MPPNDPKQQQPGGQPSQPTGTPPAGGAPQSPQTPQQPTTPPPAAGQTPPPQQPQAGGKPGQSKGKTVILLAIVVIVALALVGWLLVQAF